MDVKDIFETKFEQFSIPESLRNVRIPLTLDSLGVVSNTTKIYDLMEILKGCAQRQIQELAQVNTFLKLFIDEKVPHSRWMGITLDSYF